MPVTKPYTVTQPRQAEDIDRMFDELYQAVAELETNASSGTSTGTGMTPAQVSARVLHEL
jgi:hypothetical protein